MKIPNDLINLIYSFKHQICVSETNKEIQKLIRWRQTFRESVVFMMWYKLEEDREIPLLGYITVWYCSKCGDLMRKIKYPFECTCQNQF